MTRVMLVLVAVLLALPTLAVAQSIEGAWRLEEFESANLPSPAETPGLMILADGRYSRVFVRGREPRQPIGPDATPAEQLASWNPFIDETRLRIHVSHFPPGTSKWNKIEHRLFCHITENWRGTPLRTFETIVDRIGTTRTASGLRVHAQLDPGEYPTGMRVTKSQMDDLALLPDSFHGEWNYELLPR